YRKKPACSSGALVQVVLISSACWKLGTVIWEEGCCSGSCIWALCAASGQHLQPVLGERHLLVKAYPDKPPITKLDPNSSATAPGSRCCRFGSLLVHWWWP
ncbi:hypothetical protein CIB84_015217, partial [Bambusicola thoracicus]